MKSTGIIVEYNPFHNGHFYHLQEAKKRTQSEVAIAVMSGNFLQRGEPALASKWTRTKMALNAGVDIVIELPYSFAVQKADIFAYGAVYLLNALKCGSICFGSEEGEIMPFIHTKNFLNDHKTTYEQAINMYMKEGLSYPAALGSAFKQLNPTTDTVDLSKPNNILGFQYLSAAAKINNKIDLFTIKRKSADFHDDHLTNSTIASATAIRKSLHQGGNLESIRPFIPATSYMALSSYVAEYGQFHHWENYWPHLQYRLLTMKTRDLQKIYEVEEGIENRLIKAARRADSFLSFMKIIKTKRYTWARLQRLCTHILTATTKEDMKHASIQPKYIRLLGMTEIGRKYLSGIKKELPLPLISKVSAFPSEMLSLDLNAADVYALGLLEPARTKMLALEFAQPPILN